MILSDKEFQSFIDQMAKNLEQDKQDDCGLNNLWPFVNENVVSVNRSSKGLCNQDAI